MKTEDIKALPVAEKIQIMEAIWEDFRERFEGLDVPRDQKDLLDLRRTKVAEGAAQLRDWEAVKDSIARR